jgi:hypothetical protein
MNKIKVTALLLLFAQITFAQKYVKVSTSEPDAKIFVDGQHLGTGSLKVKVPRNYCVNVRVVKPGYLSYNETYCNKKGQTDPPKAKFFDMKKDDSFEASSKSDQANVDFSVEVNKKYDATAAWKLATQIVTDYFDAIEVSDKETSYLRTAWNVQSFAQNTIRTRFIIKLGNSNPLTYKIKLVSEYSGESGTSVKADERFREWDRVLRKYQNIITDFQTRVGYN